MKTAMKITLLCSALSLLTTSLKAQYITDVEATNKIAHATEVRVNELSKMPFFVKFDSESELTFDKLESWLRTEIGMHSDFDLVLDESKRDQLGWTHYHMHQTYQGYKIEGAGYVFHEKNGVIKKANGRLYDRARFNTASIINESYALEQAKTHVNADVYMWEVPSEEALIQEQKGDASATYFPKGRLMLVAPNGKHMAGEFNLCYEFDIYASSPTFRSKIYVDAGSGKILNAVEQLCFADATGTANTAYNGTQTIIADSFGGGYRLRESGRGIRTYNMQNGTNYGNAVDFVDTDNNWTQTGIDQYANDAHWGAEMTYDYFLGEHGRDRYDDNGAILNNYVHYDGGYANAFWN